MPTARQARGRRTNVVVAAWLKEHGWPRADPTVGAETGRDVHNITGHCVEVKARTNFDPLAWYRQAKDNAEPGERACVIIRCNGQGEHAEQYFVLRPLGEDELNRLRDGDLSSPEALAERRANAVDPGDEMRCNRCGEIGHSALDGYYHH